MLNDQNNLDHCLYKLSIIKQLPLNSIAVKTIANHNKVHVVAYLRH